MAVMAYALSPDQIAVVRGDFLITIYQVNIAVLNIRGVYGDKLNYGLKIHLFLVIPIVDLLV
jgi:hypothetical protein